MSSVSTHGTGLQPSGRAAPAATGRPIRSLELARCGLRCRRGGWRAPRRRRPWCARAARCGLCRPARELEAEVVVEGLGRGRRSYASRAHECRSSRELTMEPPAIASTPTSESATTSTMNTSHVCHRQRPTRQHHSRTTSWPLDIQRRITSARRGRRVHLGAIVPKVESRSARVSVLVRPSATAVVLL